MNLDNHIEGTFSKDHPANQPGLQRENDSITDAFEANDEEDLYSLISELRTRINRMREVCKASDNGYLLRQLNIIYNKL